MKSKIKNLGKVLTREQLKSINGGAAPPCSWCTEGCISDWDMCFPTSSQAIQHAYSCGAWRVYPVCPE